MKTVVAEARASQGAAAANSVLDPHAYFTDALFRSDRQDAQSHDASTQAEAGRILASALRQSEMSTADESYLARQISAKTGISPREADQRISEVVGAARQAEDTARKATAHFLLWFFLSLLMGAFSASFAATIGGRQRDHVPVV